MTAKLSSAEITKAFASALQKKFSSPVVGEPEDQLRAPFEALVTALGSLLGKSVVPIGEVLLDSRQGKPDFAIDVAKVRCGYVELKAPGKGAKTQQYTGHDRKQWDKFKNLPNIVYTDGIEFILYRGGQQNWCLY